MKVRFEFINARPICDEIIETTYAIIREYGIAGEKNIGILHVYNDGTERSIELNAGFPHSLAEITEIINVGLIK